MRLSVLLSLGFAVFLAFIGIVFLAVGPNPNFNTLTYALLAALVLVVQGVLSVAARGTATPFLLWLATFLFLFVCVPFVGYLLLPESFPSWRPLVHGAASLNRALLLLSAGTAAIAAGYAFGALVTAAPATALAPAGHTAYRLWIPIPFLAAIAVLFLVIEARLAARFTIYFAGNVAEGAWWRRFIAFEPLKLILVVYLLTNWHILRARDRLLVGLPVLGYVGLHAAVGSRSAIVYFGLFVLQYAMLTQGDVRVGKRLALGLTGVAVLGALVFPLATAARYLWSEVFISGASVKDVLPAGTSVAMLFNAQNYLILFTRLDLFSTMAIIVDGPIGDLGPHLGFIHDFKGFANMVVPGDPFPGIIDGSSVFPHVYLGIDAEYFTDILKYTMPWTLWGLGYARFGWAGGIVFMFLVGAASSWLYHRSGRLVPAPVRVYVQLWVFITTVGLLNTFGLDTSASAAVYELLPYAPVLGLLWLGARRRPWQPSGEAVAAASAPAG